MDPRRDRAALSRQMSCGDRDGTLFRFERPFCGEHNRNVSLVFVLLSTCTVIVCAGLSNA
jgi:hypothetical protein